MKIFKISILVLSALVLFYASSSRLFNPTAAVFLENPEIGFARKTNLQNECRKTSNKYDAQIHDISRMVTNETNIISNDFISAFKKASQL